MIENCFPLLRASLLDQGSLKKTSMFEKKQALTATQTFMVHFELTFVSVYTNVGVCDKRRWCQ